MNELKLFEAINLIDDDLVKEADQKSVKKVQTKPILSKHSFYALGSVAAAVITVCSAALYNAQKSSDLLVDHSLVQSDDIRNDFDDLEVPPTTESGAITQETQASVKSAKPTHTSEDTLSEQPAAYETTTNQSHDSDSNSQTDAKTTTVNLTTKPSQDTKQETTCTDLPAEIESSDYYYKMFDATADPYSDAYGEDELSIVSIVISGNYYYQLDSTEHPVHNIAPVISDSDFGKYIGTVVELFECDDPAKYTVSSKEPMLSGAEVYYYAPADSPSVIIVKKGDQCSIFVFNGMAAALDNSSVFAETFSFYGADSADDIESISFSIAAPNGAVMEITSQGTITDRDKINAIVDILYQLQSEKSDDPLSATPQWLIDAWDAYRADPDAYIREDIMFDITFKNGTVLKDISYQPYIGNGYISGMQELTPEQNAALKALFQ